MPEGKKKKGISRREFLAGTVGGVVVGAVVGAAAGSLGFPKTVTNTLTTTQTQTQTQTQTSTITGPTTTTTQTTTVVQSVPPGYSQDVTLNVNGNPYTVSVQNNWTLKEVLHDQLNFTSVKEMCAGKGECGACSVIMNGRPVKSCLALAVECDSAKIQTAEGIAVSGHPIVQSWADFDGMQCGYCTPGAVTTAKALLDSNPKPTSQQALEALSGNLCVCGTYPNWPLATLDAASKLKGGT